jgi:lipopolysaccharide export system permease protein
MRIIDRYLLRQFIGTFLICYVSLTGLYIVFDAFTNLDEFLGYAQKQGGLLALLGSFYVYKLIGCFDWTAALLSLIAAMFTVTRLQRHNEMTALLSAGVSRARVVAPVIGAVVVMALVAAANRELVIPRFRDQLARRPQDLIGDVGQKLEPRYDKLTEILIRGQATYRDRQRISKPRLVLPPTLWEYGTALEAEDAFYKPAKGERPSGSLLEKVDTPKDLHTKASLYLDGQAVIITPRDAPEWLAEDQCFVVSDVSFEQLAGGRAWQRYSSTADLIAGLRNPSLGLRAEVRTAVHCRLVQPLLDVTLLFLGLPLVMRRENRNVFIAIGASAVLVAVFMLVVMGFQRLGAIYALSPAQAAWAPLLIFVPVAVGMSQWMRK